MNARIHGSDSLLTRASVHWTVGVYADEDTGAHPNRFDNKIWKQVN